SGGIGVRFFKQLDEAGAGLYLQEFIEGESASAVFAGDGTGARLLGVTRQLVGAGWLNAGPFRYCGSVGPLPLGRGLQRSLDALGRLLARRAGLRGLFGVDGVLRGSAFWPVEVNPRYPASVEVLEYATRLAALRWHRQAFVPGGRLPDEAPARAA